MRRMRRVVWLVGTAIVALALLLTLYLVSLYVPVHVSTVAMRWTVDGTLPGTPEPSRGPHGELPVTLFEQRGATTCYEIVFSPRLRAHLLAVGRNPVPVVYRHFLLGSYSLASVDGIAFPSGIAPDQGPATPSAVSGQSVKGSGPSERCRR